METNANLEQWEGLTSYFRCKDIQLMRRAIRSAKKNINHYKLPLKTKIEFNRHWLFDNEMSVNISVKTENFEWAREIQDLMFAGIGCYLDADRYAKKLILHSKK